MGQGGLKAALLGCAGAVALVTVLLVPVLRARVALRRQVDIITEVLCDSSMTSTKQVASRMIETSRKILDAPGYYVYWQSSPASAATLLALDSEALRARVGISYSGLVEPTGSEYLPPYTMRTSAGAGDDRPRGNPLRPARSTAYEATVVGGHNNAAVMSREGDLLFVDVPFGSSRQGLLRIGPIKNPLHSQHALKSLSLLCTCAGRILELSSQVSSLKGDLGDARAKASVATAAGVGGGRLAETLLQLAARVSRARAGALISRAEEAPCVAAAWEVSPGEAEAASAVALSPAEVSKLAGPIDPLSFPAGERYSFVLWMKSRARLPEHLVLALELVASRMGQVMGHEQLLSQMSGTYAEALKAIVAVMDAADPSGAGHSSRVARYSREIASVMGLPDLDAIELAGLLHDIGMAALDESVLFKTGKYDRKELEEMKGHVELGGALAGALRDHSGLGSSIRHHHERWDGWGYPDGLSGASISAGARVIAVADAFCAATASKAYRPASSFGAAVEMLRASAGSQFDPAAVSAFLEWWSDRRKRATTGRSLEPCWEMIACPPAIAASCPARSSSLNCWLVQGVRCLLHGAVCDSCIVHTEYLDRHAAR